MSSESHGTDPAEFLKSLSVGEAEGTSADAAGDLNSQSSASDRTSSSTIDVVCSCGKRLRVKDEHAGRKVRCPKCQSVSQVPASASLAEPATEASTAPGPVAIDTGSPSPVSTRTRRRSGGSLSMKWLLAGGSALIVFIGILVFALREPSDPTPSEETLAQTAPVDRKKEARGSLDADNEQEIADPSPRSSANTGDNVKPADSSTKLKPETPSKSGPTTQPPPKKKTDVPTKVAKKNKKKKTAGPTKVADSKSSTPVAGKPVAEISDEKFDWLVGKPRTVTLHSGEVYEDVEITDIDPARKPKTLGVVRLKRDRDKPRRKRAPARLTGRSIRSIETPEAILLVKWDAKRRLAVVERAITLKKLAAEQAKERAEIMARLRPTGHRIWPKLSEEDHKKAIAEYKEFLVKVGKFFSARAMKFRETKYFLFYTNLPPAEVNLISKRLDAMYEQLRNAFGIPPGTNIWRGKCVIIAFYHQQDFQLFESKFMGQKVSSSVHGLAHSFGSGKVIIGCYRGKDFNYFAQVLVHETSHGFVHRYFSSARVPTWINEGMADWIANAVVPKARQIRDKQAKAIARMRTTRSLGGNFFVDGGIESWQYGVASHITEFMLRGGNGLKYRSFIEDIKKGYTWQESLKRNYGVDHRGLVTLYGRSLRIPNLQP